MCGIFGFVQKACEKSTAFDKNQQISHKILDQLRHRGPNSHGLQEIPCPNRTILTLGHTRLAIIDLTTNGHQPMVSDCGKFIISFNGEIYNFPLLRSHLQSRGHQFKTKTDTEVLLKAWIEWGPDCLNRLNGMFAFALYEKTTNNLYLVRDFFGIKPLYYSFDKSKFAFASEINPLRNFIAPKYNKDAIFNYICLGTYDITEETFFQDIFRVLPAHFLKINLDSLENIKKIKYWEPSTIQNHGSLKDSAARFREIFLENVKSHLISDLPVVTALSGGIDSASIVCSIRHIYPDTEINTFSYLDNNPNISEEKYVNIVNNHVKARSFIVNGTSKSLLNNVENTLQAQEEPFLGSSVIAQNLLYKKIKNQGFSVVLEGQGADELVAGYSGYPKDILKTMIANKKIFNLAKYFSNWDNWPNRSKIKKYFYLFEALSELLNIKDLKKLLLISTNKKFLNSKTFNQNKKNSIFIRSPQKTDRCLAETLKDALTRSSVPVLMRHADKNSMSVSVESRVPFLNKALAEFCLQLPDNFLVSNSGETKCILREAMKGIVPESIINRKDKVGFAADEKNLLMKLFWNQKQATLNSSIFNRKSCENQIKADLNINSSKIICESTWRLLNLNWWLGEIQLKQED